LVKPHHEEGASTKGLSREHTVSVSPSGLVTVTGGKWTTYRAMAHDVLSQCLTSQLLQFRNPSQHPAMLFKGASRPQPSTVSLTAPQGMHLYGDEQAAVAALSGADNWLLPGLSEAMVRFAVRHEFARTVEDVLARRSRALFLDARQSAAAAEQVATVLLSEGCEKPELSEYLSLAHSYTLKSVP
jgi:glycerol-3-phosphate dehydrogenase